MSFDPAQFGSEVGQVLVAVIAGYAAYRSGQTHKQLRPAGRRSSTGGKATPSTSVAEYVEEIRDDVKALLGGVIDHERRLTNIERGRRSR